MTTSLGRSVAAVSIAVCPGSPDRTTRLGRARYPHWEGCERSFICRHARRSSSINADSEAIGGTTCSNDNFSFKASARSPGAPLPHHCVVVGLLRIGSSLHRPCRKCSGMLRFETS